MMKNGAKNIMLILLGTILLHVLFAVEDMVLRMIENTKEKFWSRKRPEKVRCVAFVNEACNND